MFKSIVLFALLLVCIYSVSSSSAPKTAISVVASQIPHHPSQSITPLTPPIAVLFSAMSMDTMVGLMLTTRMQTEPPPRTVHLGLALMPLTAAIAVVRKI